MAVRKTRVEKCLVTVEAIVSSDQVDQYLIGYTALAAGKKGDEYRRIGFEHLVILADKMDCDTALDLEDALQRRTLWGDPNSIVEQKYHAEKKSLGRSVRSDGGTKRERVAKEFSVYMAWWNH